MTDLYDDIEVSSYEDGSDYKPSTDLNRFRSPEDQAKKAALGAKTRRWLLKREGQEIEEDHRTPQEALLDNLAKQCEEFGWEYTFDPEDIRVRITKDSQFVFVANLEHGGSGIVECFFLRKCATVNDLVEAIQAGFNYVSSDPDAKPQPKGEAAVEDEYEKVIEQAVLNLWMVQGDEKNPDKITLSKTVDDVAWHISVLWSDDGTLRSSVGRKLSNFIDVFQLMEEYGDKNGN